VVEPGAYPEGFWGSKNNVMRKKIGSHHKKISGYAPEFNLDGFMVSTLSFVSLGLALLLFLNQTYSLKKSQCF